MSQAKILQEKAEMFERRAESATDPISKQHYKEMAAHYRSLAVEHLDRAVKFRAGQRTASRARLDLRVSDEGPQAIDDFECGAARRSAQVGDDSIVGGSLLVIHRQVDVLRQQVGHVGRDNLRGPP